MKIYQANKDVAIHEANTSHQKLFYTHKLQKSGDIKVKQIRPATTTFKEIVHNIGMHQGFFH